MKSNAPSRRSFLKNSAIGITAAVFSNPGTSGILSRRSSSKPNVLFLFTDQQSIMAMSGYGNNYLHTPHMDRLAENGARFENSYCTAPVCGPARSSFLTGLMPHQTGVIYNGDSIKSGIPNMGDVFRYSGYETAWTGKWHLPYSYPEIRWEKGGPRYIENASIPGFDFMPTPRGTQFRLGSQTDTHVTANAVEFLRRKHDNPFLLGVSLHNPHDVCWTVRDELGTAPAHVVLPPLPPNFDIDPDEPEFIRQCRKREKYGPEIQFTKGWDKNRWRVYLNRYYSLAEEVDREVGQILTELRKQNLEEETIIIFTSDHGEGMAAHQWVVKLMLWEEVAGVPMIASWKGTIPEGTVNSRHFASGMDVLPTMCDYAGIRNAPPMTGMSMRPAIENSSFSGREYIVTELYPDPNKRDMAARMVRTQRYKYIAFSSGDRREMLFDRELDEAETRNLAYKPEMTGIVNTHRNHLRDWIRETKDPFTYSL